jgi:hypothetical protein
MYASWMRFSTAPGAYRQVRSWIAALRPQLEALPGYRRVVFVGNVDAGDFGALGSWESEAHARDGNLVVLARAHQDLGYPVLTDFECAWEVSEISAAEP